ncbi:hypothetical protein ES5_13595 [Dietzia cinnamea P4]|nr:hypothetical protein ES5_13595 [Dietzia cinnamea P4]
MSFRRLGIALALGAALSAASCSSDAGEQAESAASDAGASAASAVDEAGDAVSGAMDDASDEPTDASPQDLLLTPEEAGPMPMQAADPALLAQAGAGLEMPEGMELEVDPPECADAADMNATLAGDVSDGGLAALMGGGEDGSAMFTVQVLRTGVSFDEYKTNWENCAEVRFSGQALGITGTSAEVDAPEIEGADEVLARTSDTQVEALGEGGRMTNIVYLTEVRGVKVLAGAMTAPDSGGEIGPDAEAELADLLTKQVEKVNNAG